MIRVLFYGTSSWTIPVLSALIADARFSVLGVVTQPDKPAGRHGELQASPIKQFVIKRRLPLYQFEKVKSDEAYEVLKTVNVDVAVLASFGQIIPQRVLDLYPYGIINIHPSLLPLYRGSSPIVSPIKNGDTVTGVSIMKMDALLDHGPVLTQVEEPIRSDDTAAALEERLAHISASILPDTLANYIEGKLIPQEQKHESATVTKILKREDGLIDWNRSAEEIERTIRAYTPWPGTYTTIDGKRLKIFKAAIGHKVDSIPGTRIVQNNVPAIVCGDQTALQLLSVQLEGKTIIDGVNFLKGQRGWGNI